MNNKKTLLAILCLVVLTVVISLIGSVVPLSSKDKLEVQASSADYKLTGWAWSSNIGWIHFGNAAGNSYGVTVSSSTGQFSNYAWANPRDEVAGSNNIGWLQFDPGGAFPADSNDTPPNKDAHNAKLETSGARAGTVTGWARFIGADSNGWDGWVKMSGNTDSGGSYGVHKNAAGDGLIGYAWGGEVAGWINFAPRYDGGAGPCDVLKQVCIDNPGGNNDLRVTCSAHIDSYDSTAHKANVTWSADVYGDHGPFTYSWSGGGSGTSKTVNGLADGRHSMTITVSDSASPVNTDSVSCDVEIGSGGPGDTGDAGVLTVNPLDSVIYIGEQVAGHTADSIVKVTRPGAEISNTGADGSVISDIKIDSIRSAKAGNKELKQIISDVTPSGPSYTCSLFETVTGGDFKSCSSLGSLAQGAGNKRYLRIRIPTYMKEIADNSPYTVTISGVTGTSSTPVSATLIFKYLVGTYNPQ